jgi:hypothetical protein
MKEYISYIKTRFCIYKLRDLPHYLVSLAARIFSIFTLFHQYHLSIKADPIPIHIMSVAGANQIDFGKSSSSADGNRAVTDIHQGTPIGACNNNAELRVYFQAIWAGIRESTYEGGWGGGQSPLVTAKLPTPIAVTSKGLTNASILQASIKRWY